MVGRDDDVQRACFNHYMPRTLKPDALLRRDGLPCRPMILANCRSRPPCPQGLAEPVSYSMTSSARASSVGGREEDPKPPPGLFDHVMARVRAGISSG